MCQLVPSRMRQHATTIPHWEKAVETVNRWIWTASSEFGTYRLWEQRRFRRACASTQSRQNLRYSLIQAVSQEEPSDRKPDPWPLWMARHAQLKFVMTECSKTQIRLTGLIQVTTEQKANITCFLKRYSFLPRDWEFLLTLMWRNYFWYTEPYVCFLFQRSMTGRP